MRNIKKIVALLLTFIVIFGCISCKKPSESAGSTATDQTITEKFILQKGVSEYKIVIPQNANYFETLAGEELKNLFLEATGFTLEIINDNNRQFNEKDKYFSIGNTALLETSGIDKTAKIEHVGDFQIITKGDTIFFFGDAGKGTGVLFAVYEYLWRNLNFEQLSYDCYTLDKGVLNLPLYNYNVADGADFYNFNTFSGYMRNDNLVMYRMKCSFEFAEFEGRINGVNIHNTLEYLDKDIYCDPSDEKNYHPEWYSAGTGTQLCYIARGDDESLDLMIETYANRMIGAIKEMPNKTIWYIHSGSDDSSCCTCPECNNLKRKYGCNTAQVIWFVNRVYDKIMEWFNTEEGKPYYSPDFRGGISFYEAYNETPARYNEQTKKWEPIDDSVVLKKGILAGPDPAYASWQVPLTDPLNSYWLDNVYATLAICQETKWWIYATNFVGNYLMPYDNFSSMQENYQFIYNVAGSRTLMDQTQNGNSKGMTGFHMLKSYLQNKLAWDIYADVPSLIERFFRGYFLDAADDMLTFFYSYLNFSKLQMDGGLCPGIGAFTYDIGKREYWPKPIIDAWQIVMDGAMQKIDKYKTINPATYDMLYDHLMIERVFLDYILLRFYKGDLGSEMPFYRERFVEGITIGDIQQVRAGRYVQDFVDTLYS